MHEQTEQIRNQPKKEEFINKNQEIHKDFLMDMAKLEDILHQQIKQLQELKSEIKMLKTKGMAPKASVVEVKEEKEHAEWPKYDEYIMTAEEAEEELFLTEITMPKL